MRNSRLLPSLALALPSLLLACGGDDNSDLFAGGYGYGPSTGGASGHGGQAGGSLFGGASGSSGGVNGGGMGGSSGKGGSAGAKGGSAGSGGSLAGGSGGSGGAAGSGGALAGGSGGAGQAGAAQGGSAGKAGSSQAGGASQGGAGQGGASQGGASQGGASQGGASQGGASQGGASQGGAGQGGSPGQGGSAAGGSGQGGSSGNQQGGSGGSLPFCGDGVRNNGEACDGADLGGATCASQTGYPASSGALVCTAGCVFDTSGCSAAPTCGDGKKNGSEQCDGADLAGQSCASVTGGVLPAGALACSPSCAFDASGCQPPPPVCGDGKRNGSEACEGADLGGASCSTVVPGSTGTLSCTGGCTYDTSLCVKPTGCGNGLLDPGEECDDKNTTLGDGCEACKVVCLAGEKKLGTHCYAESTEAKTWPDAASACKAEGGYLVSITSSEEQSFVASQVLSAPQVQYEKRWIGMSDTAVEGVFVWQSGEPFVYTAWRSGEPNNANDSEDCGAIYVDLKLWNDDVCSKAYRFVCEYPPPVAGP